MSYFRNFGNVVSSQLYTKTNNLLLRSCNLPPVLCESIDPSINHLHSVKSLLSTISALRNHQTSTEGQYKEEIQSQLQYLQSCKNQYQVSIRKYVQSSGNLTAQGIANVYAVAEELGLNKGWLQNYVHDEIPNKAQYMSRANLSGLLESLSKYHSDSPHVSLVQKLLEAKNNNSSVYVTRVGNQINQFQYCDSPKSNHDLINALQSQVAFPVYTARKWWGLVYSRVLSYIAEPRQYNLH